MSKNAKTKTTKSTKSGKKDGLQIKRLTVDDVDNVKAGTGDTQCKDAGAKKGDSRDGECKGASVGPCGKTSLFDSSFEFE